MDDVEKGIENQVHDFIIDNYLFGNKEEALDPEASFLELQLIDSTGVLELVQFLESAFNIQIVDEELVPDNLDSVRQIGKFVASKKGRT